MKLRIGLHEQILKGTSCVTKASSVSPAYQNFKNHSLSLTPDGLFHIPMGNISLVYLGNTPEKVIWKGKLLIEQNTLNQWVICAAFFLHWMLISLVIFSAEQLFELCKHLLVKTGCSMFNNFQAYIKYTYRTTEINQVTHITENKFFSQSMYDQMHLVMPSSIFRRLIFLQQI